MTRVRTLLLALLLTCVPSAALACPVCFQNAESPLLDSARLGVVVMAGITLCVLGAFGAWFLKLRRLQQDAADEERS